MQLCYEKKGTIGKITIVNPPQGAMVHPVFADLGELQEFYGDQSLKAVIIQGQKRHFCSGADPESFSALFKDKKKLKTSLSKALELLETIRYAPLPTLAVIFGSCLGGGLEIALSCHFRFATRSAMFGFPESGHGLMPGMGGTINTQQQVGSADLMELILSGRLIGAEEAQNLGLVDQVFLPKAIEKESLQFLDSLTQRHSAKLIRSVMQSIHNGSRLNREVALAEETRLFCDLAAETNEV